MRLRSYEAVFPAVPRLGTRFMVEETRYRAHRAGYSVTEGPAAISWHDNLETLGPIVIVGIPVESGKSLTCGSVAQKISN